MFDTKRNICSFKLNITGKKSVCFLTPLLLKINKLQGHVLTRTRDARRLIKSKISQEASRNESIKVTGKSVFPLDPFKKPKSQIPKCARLVTPPGRFFLHDVALSSDPPLSRSEIKPHLPKSGNHYYFIYMYTPDNCCYNRLDSTKSRNKLMRPYSFQG